jgi:hypothetical protein
MKFEVSEVRGHHGVGISALSGSPTLHVLNISSGMMSHGALNSGNAMSAFNSPHNISDCNVMSSWLRGHSNELSNI